MQTPSNSVIQDHILDWTSTLHLNTQAADWLALLIVLALIFISSLTGFYIIRALLSRLARNLSSMSYSSWIQSACKYRVFHRVSLIIPALIVYSSINAASIADFTFMPALIKFVEKSSAIYIIIVGSLTIASLFNCVESQLQRFTLTRHYSIKSYFQVAKLVIYSLAGIVVTAMLMNKSPMYFITGLGAMTAVLMLVFRDSILGFVASIQVSAYDIVRIGDWIEMPAFGANGTVIDISLNTIKVQNFDNTIITIPSYSILSNGVKNWRGMKESGGRRIKRAIYLDVNSIRFCDEPLLNRLSQIPLLHSVLTGSDQWPHNENQRAIARLAHADERGLTNLALFRMYIDAYLREHPKIHHNMTFIVRELEATGKGIPIEIYLFSNDTDWVCYEMIQADIFDYFYAILPLFDLKAFQYLSGSSLAFSTVSRHLQSTLQETSD